jgi:hypothetical protein
MADILDDLIPRFLDLFEGEPTLDDIFAITGPGEQYDFGSGHQVRLTADYAVFNVSVDEEPEYGITQVTISHMTNPPTLDQFFERYGRVEPGVFSAPGRRGYRWTAIREMDEDHWVSLVAGTIDDQVTTVSVQR